MTEGQLAYIKLRLIEIVDEKVNKKKNELFENGDVSLPDITSEDIFNAILNKEATLVNPKTAGHLIRSDLDWPSRKEFEQNHHERLKQLREFKDKVNHEKRRVMDQIMFTAQSPLSLVDQFAEQTIY